MFCEEIEIVVSTKNVNASEEREIFYIKIGQKSPEVLCSTWIQLLDQMEEPMKKGAFQIKLWESFGNRAKILS